MRICGLIAGLLLVSCGTESGEPVDALVVVQETNLTACQLANSYERTVTRQCDGTAATVGICSDAELCDAQLDELVRSIEACTNTEDSFTATTDAVCK